MTADDVMALNRHAVQITGENYALLFPDRLQSAVERAKNQFRYAGLEDLFLLAVHCMYAVSKAHAFEQGNKRAAFQAGMLFLHQNGYELRAPKHLHQYLAAQFADLSADLLTVSDYTAIIDPYIEPIEL